MENFKDRKHAVCLTGCLTIAIREVSLDSSKNHTFVLYSESTLMKAILGMADSFVMENYPEIINNEPPIGIRALAVFNDSFPYDDFSKEGKDRALSFLTKLYTSVKENENG